MMKSVLKSFQTLPATLALTVSSMFVLCASPVAAQTRAALVQSVDEPGRNPYQETLSDLACRGTAVCSFNFAAVPAGKRLVVTRIVGYIDTAAGTIPNGFLQSSLGGSQYVTMPFGGVRGPTGFLGTRIHINSDAQAYFGAGENPRVSMQTFGGDTVSGGSQIMLTGYYINVP